MATWLVIIFLGWSSIISSLVISIIGVIANRGSFVLVGAILAIPFSWYIAMTPLFGYWGFMFPVTLAGAAIASRQRVNWLAWILLLPYTVLVVWMAATVLTQHS